MLENLTKQQKLIILGLVLLIFSGLGVMVFRRHFSNGAGEIIISQVEPEEARARVIVHVSGAVGQAGVYGLEPEDRVVDAISAAGGASPLADLSKLNLAQKLKDGDKVFVPARDRPSAKSADDKLASPMPATQRLININTADEKELCKLTGVGKVTARRLLDYRAQHGLFLSIEELMKVKSISKKKFEKLKNEICAN